MSILQSTDEPVGGAALAAHALVQICRPASGKTGLRQLSPNDIKIGQHHAIFDLAADVVAAGGKTDHAKRNGSRYLLSVDGNISAAVEIEIDATSAHAVAFQSLNAGLLVLGTEKAIRLAESQPDDEHCHFSLLRLPALKLWILWVKPVDPLRKAKFYAIDPAPGALQTDRPYTEDALFAVLMPMAQDLLTRPPGAGPLVG